MNKDEFEKIIQEKTIAEFVQEYLFDGVPYCFKDDPSKFNLFRLAICNRFNIHPQNLTIVGSAKIGFSLSPEKYGSPFSDASDIDVVLVSEELFQDLWLRLIEFKKTTVYRLSKYHRDRFRELQVILFYGSIRLDMISNDFAFTREWWEFFNTLSTDKRFGPRQIRAMIFKSWRHVSFYYENGVRKVTEHNESNGV